MTKEKLKLKLAELRAEREEARRDSFPATEYALDLAIREVQAQLINAK